MTGYIQDTFLHWGHEQTLCAALLKPVLSIRTHTNAPPTP